jgi:diadenosine tetraphosphate (Ap4A) HIT family hydrolase
MSDYEQSRIATYEHWGVFLHPSQYYLGRTYVWANRDEAKDITDATAPELHELADITLKLNEAYAALWKPDRLNYASFGNEADHLHIHFIPRYREPRTFGDRVFKDGRWGQNYAPYDKTFEISEETRSAILDALRAQLG